MKEAADKAARAQAERTRLAAEARGDVDAKKIVDAMDDVDGRTPYRDELAEIVARAAAEEES